LNSELPLTKKTYGKAKIIFILKRQQTAHIHLIYHFILCTVLDMDILIALVFLHYITIINKFD
jgi:hypothetical protein